MRGPRIWAVQQVRCVYCHCWKSLLENDTWLIECLQYVVFVVDCPDLCFCYSLNCNGKATNLYKFDRDTRTWEKLWVYLSAGVMGTKLSKKKHCVTALCKSNNQRTLHWSSRAMINVALCRCVRDFTQSQWAAQQTTL